MSIVAERLDGSRRQFVSWRPHCARWKPRSPPRKWAHPHFSAHVYCGQTARWIKMPFDTKIVLDSGHIGLHVDSAPHKGHSSPIFGLCVLWPKGCIEIWMPLGMDIGLGPGGTVLDPAPLLCAPALIFGPCLLWPNGWMDQDATWYGGRPRPRPHYTRRGFNPQKGGGVGHSPPPIFGPCLLWPNCRPSQLLLNTCICCSAYTRQRK